MKILNHIKLIVCFSLVALLSGCFEEELPELNDENCTFKNIKKIKDKEKRTEFADACARR